jgi:hypothetical protein
MANKTLLDYIQKSLANNASEQQIRSTLLQQGWNNNDIDQAFVEINTQQNITSFIPPAPNRKLIVKILISLASLLVLGGVGYFVFNFIQDKIQDKTFENGNEILKKITTSYNDIKSFEFQGVMKIKTREENAKSAFQGAAMPPLTIQITQETDNLSRYNDPEHKTPKTKNYHRETIVVGNKIFEKLSKKSEWEFNNFITNPLEKKILGYQPRPLPNISWLALNYADNLNYIYTDGDLYHYKIIPKGYKFGSAFGPIQNFRITPGVSSFDENRVNTTISGEIWINKNYQIIREKYNIPSYYGGINIEINYSNYGKNMSIKAPINASAIDEFYEQVKSGKDLKQAGKKYQDKLYAQNPDWAAKQRDERRLRDIIQVLTILDMSRDIDNAYPISLDNLQHGIGHIPTAPVPPDGNCTEEQNKYKYTRTSPTTFKLTFCLGNQRPPLPAGFQTMTEKGIKCIGEKQNKPSYCLPPNKTTH